MIIKEISKEEFDNYSKKHILTSLYQTSSYGTLMNKMGYKDIYIAAYNNDSIIGASLILTKNISLNVKYGYSPRGFLIDYYDTDLLIEFTSEIKKYFNKHGYAFIKINPIITLSEINIETKEKNYSTNGQNLINTLEKLNYKKLKNNLYFESVLPKYNPIVNLKNFNISFLDNKLESKINAISSKGLKLVKGDLYNINDYFELVKKKDDLETDFYKTLYKTFDEKGLVDLFLLEIDYHDYLLHLQDEYSIESTINHKINKLFQANPKDKSMYNEKMISDKRLNELNEEMTIVSLNIQKGLIKTTVASALIIKYNGVVNFYSTGFDKKFSKLLPNHFMHYLLLDYYKKEGYLFADLNGITGDFTNENPYKGLNEFKLNWKPRIFEYIGEFDLIINPTKYQLLWSTKTLHREFEKKGLKTIS